MDNDTHIDPKLEKVLAGRESLTLILQDTPEIGGEQILPILGHPVVREIGLDGYGRLPTTVLRLSRQQTRNLSARLVELTAPVVDGESATALTPKPRSDDWPWWLLPGLKQLIGWIGSRLR